jgi:hypothetical protein
VYGWVSLYRHVNTMLSKYPQYVLKHVWEWVGGGYVGSPFNPRGNTKPPTPKHTLLGRGGGGGRMDPWLEGK